MSILSSRCAKVGVLWGLSYMSFCIVACRDHPFFSLTTNSEVGMIGAHVSYRARINNSNVRSA